MSPQPLPLCQWWYLYEVSLAASGQAVVAVRLLDGAGKAVGWMTGRTEVRPIQTETETEQHQQDVLVGNLQKHMANLLIDHLLVLAMIQISEIF